MSSIATTNETRNVTSLPSAPKPQTSKEVISANVKLLIEQLFPGHRDLGGDILRSAGVASKGHWMFR